MKFLQTRMIFIEYVSRTNSIKRTLPTLSDREKSLLIDIHLELFRKKAKLLASTTEIQEPFAAKTADNKANPFELQAF